MADRITDTFIPHLNGQFERGFPILFTGAGFSLGTRNHAGAEIPSVGVLRRALWDLCFPGQSFEDNSSLQNLFDFAQRRHSNQLGVLLRNLLSVDPASLADWYRLYFSLPWARVFTLNVDDLAVAASRRFTIPRPVRTISATSSRDLSATLDLRTFNVVHLNGTLEDLPDNVVFSSTQYAERLARHDPWYVRLVSDLVTRSVVFVGTTLEEPPLWQHLELRRRHGGRGLRELRPRSYLVTKNLDRARTALLADYNVEYLDMTAEEFAEFVLSECTAVLPAGLEALNRLSVSGPQLTEEIPEVAALARSPLTETEYLRGEEPIWADVQAGRAALRDCDAELEKTADEALAKASGATLVVITGTAGSGKSTALMRLALKLSAAGTRVGWIGRDEDVSPASVRAQMLDDKAPPVLAIDDADRYGSQLPSMIREIGQQTNVRLIVVAIRSAAVTRVLNPTRLEGFSVHEFTMPNLTDSDIDELLRILEHENRLGILQNLSRHEQEKAFRNQAGRILLVAMYQATSGQKFEAKVTDELKDLTAEERVAYSAICLATTFRYEATRDDVLIACGDTSNRMLNIINDLSRRHLVVGTRNAGLRARHRVIAEFVRDHLRETGEIAKLIPGLALAAAAKIGPGLPRSAPPARLIRALINHDFLIRTIGPEAARNLYGELEQVLRWDSHYWLQRGSLEVEGRNLRDAEIFLDQARGLAGDDPLVETEYAYLIFCRAIAEPFAHTSPGLARQATETLEDLIERRGVIDSYPYHILGSQGLSWVRRGIAGTEEKVRYLRRLLATVSRGCEKHPRVKELWQLKSDLEKDLWSLAIPTDGK